MSDCAVCRNRVWPWDLLYWFRWKWPNRAAIHGRCCATLSRDEWCRIAGIENITKESK